MSAGSEEAEERRAQMRESWERVSAGWGRQADRVRASGMPIAAWMIDHAELQPGLRVLELAAGPGDIGFMAAELVAPGGSVICSDGAEGMLDVARERAAELGVENVEFRQLELEWIDLPAASLDVILCRWGVMLCLDPAAALRECRRVLRPGGRLVTAVWDLPERNPAMTLPGQVAVELELSPAPPPGGPGPFALSRPGLLVELMEEAGFVDIVLDAIDIERRYPSVRDWIGESLDLSMMFGAVWRGLDGETRARLTRAIGERAEPYTDEDGSLLLPGRSLVARAEA